MEMILILTLLGVYMMPIVILYALKRIYLRQFKDNVRKHRNKR